MLTISIFLTQLFLFCSCIEIKPIGDVKQLIGKAPHWDANRKSLYYVDMASPKEKIFRYDFKENRIYGASIANESSLAGFIIPIDGREDKFAVGLNRSVKVVKWDGKSPQAQVYCTQFELDADIKTNRVTISKADPSGRLFIGTMRTNLCTPSSNLPTGSVYRSIDGKQPQRVIGDVRVSNAMVWNPKTNKYYYTDSCRFEIREYDWNPKTGDLSNERIAYDFKKLPSDQLPYGPDGLTIDTNGFLYSGSYNGSAVYKIDPKTSKIVQKIDFPAQIVKSLGFGGPDLDIVFSTSSSVPLVPGTGLLDRTQKLAPLSGSLFAIKGLGAKGYSSQNLDKSFASCAPKKGFF